MKNFIFCLSFYIQLSEQVTIAIHHLLLSFSLHFFNSFLCIMIHNLSQNFAIVFFLLIQSNCRIWFIYCRCKIYKYALRKYIHDILELTFLIYFLLYSLERERERERWRRRLVLREKIITYDIKQYPVFSYVNICIRKMI